ncbi:YceD family protein [Chitinimonas lacunae]|uniref:Large ribosomal RNA subunit accumulation protein YceD n=1 Tax=Chitinimonas lacunae TaxID=1963018 RepID=A0ABV8MQC8_9NEIS
MSDLIFDNGEFARLEKARSGELTLDKLPRLASDVLGGGPVVFELVGGSDRRRRYTLDLRLQGALRIRCQRCLGEMPFDLDVATRFTLFSDEARLDAAEAEDEDIDGLLIEREFDLKALIEDEILLTLPYAPVHEQCAPTAQAVEDAAKPQKPNPFAVLAGLKGRLKSDDGA